MAKIALTKKEALQNISGVVGDNTLLFPAEVAKILGCSNQFVSSLKKRGALKLDSKQDMLTKESLLEYMTTKSRWGRPMKRD